MMDKRERKYRIDCDCGGEILDITYWTDDEPRIYFLSMYKSSAGMGLWWRLKQAWKYFRSGEFEGNNIVLQEIEFKQFVDAMQEIKTTRQKEIDQTADLEAKHEV